MSSNLCAAASAALLTASATFVHAQSADIPRSVAPPASAASASATGYRSAFEGYRSFNDQPLESWRKANDLVGQIGGWRAYAREGQGGPPAGSAPAASGSASAPSMSGMPGMREHGMTPPSRGASGAGAGHKMP